MTTAWSEFFPELLPDVPGCSDPTAERALRNSAIELCERGLIWSVDHEAVPVVAAVAAYDFEPEPETLVISIRQGSLNGAPITAKSPLELASIYPNWQTRTGTPLYVTQSGPRVYRLVPIPVAADAIGFIATVYVKPTRDATGLEDYLYEEWLEAIVSGAKARLMMTPNERYTNERMGAAHARMFAMAIASASIRASRSFTRNNMETAIRDSYR